MVTALVLMNVERGKINDVVQSLLRLKGVSEVFSVAGQYDAIALLRTETNDQIADLVTGHLRDIPHITHTETLIAFRAFSRDDLSAAFSIGSDEPTLDT